jgi:hypothetical protein
MDESVCVCVCVCVHTDMCILIYTGEGIGGASDG